MSDPGAVFFPAGQFQLPVTDSIKIRENPAQLRIGSLERFQLVLLGPAELALKVLCMNYRSFRWIFSHLPPAWLAWTSRLWAQRAVARAAHRVPAYAHYLAHRRAPDRAVPETDKDSYIRAYSTEERSVDGRLPREGVMIDESSGSTGTPYNWVRSQQERTESHRTISFFATYGFGRGPWITINAFSMGSWATGINTGIALQKNGPVKNTGPDIAKILHTLEFFGPGHDYLIAGYPPFLKRIIDEAQTRRFPLGKYRLFALVGGEGMAEGLRDYLRQRFTKVYSGYGATDLEIGIAGETPLTVAIRRLARDHPAVRQALFGDDSRLPMIFQYNPLMHHIEVNANRELLFTITRRSLLSPRIRYNVHDQGGVARFDEINQTLLGLGFDVRHLPGVNADELLTLPLLWVYGRRDNTISVMGANIYPEDLEHCLYAEPALARITRSFCLAVAESAHGGVRPCFNLEIESDPGEELQQQFQQRLLDHLIRLNADFREAWKEYPETLVPEIRLYRSGEGPFALDQGKIKQTRLLKKL
jgi:phenylacetate-CoA ligase